MWRARTLHPSPCRPELHHEAQAAARKRSERPHPRAEPQQEEALSASTGRSNWEETHSIHPAEELGEPKIRSADAFALLRLMLQRLHLFPASVLTYHDPISVRLCVCVCVYLRLSSAFMLCRTLWPVTPQSSIADPAAAAAGEPAAPSFFFFFLPYFSRSC